MGILIILYDKVTELLNIVLFLDDNYLDIGRDPRVNNQYLGAVNFDGN